MINSEAGRARPRSDTHQRQFKMLVGFAKGSTHPTKGKFRYISRYLVLFLL